MTLQRAITYMVYASDPNVAPDGISQARWSAIVKFIKRNLKQIRQATYDFPLE